MKRCADCRNSILDDSDVGVRIEGESLNIYLCTICVRKFLGHGVMGDLRRQMGLVNPTGGSTPGTPGKS